MFVEKDCCLDNVSNFLNFFFLLLRKHVTTFLKIKEILMKTFLWVFFPHVLTDVKKKKKK